MWMFLWICPGVVLLLVALAAWAYFAMERQEQHCRKHGKRVLGWIVQANTALYSTGGMGSPAQILVCFDARTDPPDPFMQELAVRVGALKGEDPDSADEAEVAALVNDERYRATQRAQLPRSFTEGRTVYSMHIWVNREHLPAGRLNNAYVRCYVLEQERATRPVMAPYEPCDEGFRLRKDDIWID